MPVWSDKKMCTVAHMLEQMRKPGRSWRGKVRGPRDEKNKE